MLANRNSAVVDEEWVGGPAFEQRALKNTPAVYASRIIARATAQGFDPSRLLRFAGIEPAELAIEGGTITPQQYSKLVNVAITTMRDELIGYGPAPAAVGSWFMACNSAIQCQNLGDALRRICKFYGLFRDGVHPRLTIVGSDAKLSFHLPHVVSDFEPEFFLYELLIFAIHRFSNWLINEYLPLNSLSYSLPRPSYATHLNEFFLTTLLQFEAPVTSLTFDRRFLQQPVVQTKETLQPFLSAGFLTMFTTVYAPVSWTSRIKALIGRDLNAVPEYDDVANKLAIHSQTLRRRLAEEKTNYRQLKVQVRRDDR